LIHIISHYYSAFCILYKKYFWKFSVLGLHGLLALNPDAAEKKEKKFDRGGVITYTYNQYTLQIWSYNKKVKSGK